MAGQFSQKSLKKDNTFEINMKHHYCVAKTISEKSERTFLILLMYKLTINVEMLEPHILITEKHNGS